MSNYYPDEDREEQVQPVAWTRYNEKCNYCEDAKELWWMPNTGGLRDCKYCPECGRKL